MNVREAILELQKADPESPVMINEEGSIFSFEVRSVQIEMDIRNKYQYGVIFIGGFPTASHSDEEISGVKIGEVLHIKTPARYVPRDDFNMLAGEAWTEQEKLKYIRKEIEDKASQPTPEEANNSKAD